MTMRLKADFLIHIQNLQGHAANDNSADELEFTVRNLVTSELTNTLAKLTRDEGAP